MVTARTPDPPQHAGPSADLHSPSLRGGDHLAPVDDVETVVGPEATIDRALETVVRQDAGATGDPVDREVDDLAFSHVDADDLEPGRDHPAGCDWGGVTKAGHKGVADEAEPVVGGEVEAVGRGVSGEGDVGLGGRPGRPGDDRLPAPPAVAPLRIVEAPARGVVRVAVPGARNHLIEVVGVADDEAGAPLVDAVLGGEKPTVRMVMEPEGVAQSPGQ